MSMQFLRYVYLICMQNLSNAYVICLQYACNMHAMSICCNSIAEIPYMWCTVVISDKKMLFFTLYLKTEQNLNRTWPNSIHTPLYTQTGRSEYRAAHVKAVHATALKYRQFTPTWRL